MLEVNDFDLSTTLRQVRRTVPQLARLSGGLKNKALLAMAKRLRDQLDQLLEANTLDLEKQRGQPYSEWVLEGMKLTPERIQRSAQQMETLANLPDPIGVIDRCWRGEDGTLFSRYRVPLGVLALIYEVYPEFAISGISMALKSGNGIVVSSSGAIAHTHQALVSLLSEAAYAAGVPEGTIQSIPEEDVQPFQAGASQTIPLLQQSRYLDLVIPCGRPNWVESIHQASSTAVLITRLGHGHVYIDASASWKQVQSALLSSLGHHSPDLISALQPVIVWILVHKDWSPNLRQALLTELTHQGFSLQVGSQMLAQFPQMQPIQEILDSTEHPHIRLQQVDTLTEAITWINKNGHRQSEAILSDSQQTVQRFVQEVDAATIYVNSSLLPSTRNLGIPSMGASRNGFSLGISVQKLHVRGPIDLESLTTVKYIAVGESSGREKDTLRSANS